ncbi:leucyl aminopeptidase [Paenibacillaceae bacterium]|nr:leucyl aminopeptidase [Paenibacillaceae bacterium]
MKFIIGLSDQAQVKVIPVFKDRLQTSAALSELTLKEHMGAKGAITWFFGRSGQPHLLLVGVGEESALTAETLRAVAGAAGRAVETEQLAHVAVSMEVFEAKEATLAEKSAALSAIVEGWLLGTYVFDKYKAKKTERHVEQVNFLTDSSDALEQAIREGVIRAEGTKLARDLGNEPPNQLYPESLAKRVTDHFSTEKNVQITVYQGEQLQQKQMNGILAVGKGSSRPPALIEIRYAADPSQPLIALVGKGITFDTGGISLKSGRDLSGMRIDMGGAAAVIGAMHIIVQNKLQANVVALIATAENMPDGGAMLPGEVIQYANQVSVQVKNTDAEGRLVLADALIHATNLGAVKIVDIATLTGACAVSLGDRIAGVWGTEDVAEELRGIGKLNGDKVWPMPLEDDYEVLLKSHYADVSNISVGPYAGAITAALFLRKFVGESVQWAHVDMAGPMESDATKGYITAGATGFGARLLADFAERSAQQ